MGTWQAVTHSQILERVKSWLCFGVRIKRKMAECVCKKCGWKLANPTAKYACEQLLCLLCGSKMSEDIDERKERKEKPNQNQI